MFKCESLGDSFGQLINCNYCLYIVLSLSLSENVVSENG